MNQGLTTHVLGTYRNVTSVRCGHIGKRRWSCRIEDRGGKSHVKNVDYASIFHSVITFDGAPGFVANYGLAWKVGECHVSKIPLSDSVEMVCHERGKPVN